MQGTAVSAAAIHNTTAVSSSSSSISGSRPGGMWDKSVDALGGSDVVTRRIRVYTKLLLLFGIPTAGEGVLLL